MAESLIWSEEELKKFYDYFYQSREMTDTDFFCLASRRKYLTEEEKADIKMGDTVMLCKTVLKDYNWPKFLSKIKQADAMAEFVLDSNDNYIPKKCFVMYMNVNHTNVTKAIKEFKETMAGWDADTMTLLEYGNTEKRKNLCRQYKSASEGLLKAFQNPKNGEDDWIDIDCDLDGCDEFQKELRANACLLALKGLLYSSPTFDAFSYILPKVIITHGGFHILVSKRHISMTNEEMSKTTSKKEMGKKAITPEKLRKAIMELVGEENSKEVIINPNKMVPIPGTIQGGYRVRMLG